MGDPLKKEKPENKRISMISDLRKAGNVTTKADATRVAQDIFASINVPISTSTYKAQGTASSTIFDDTDAKSGKGYSKEYAKKAITDVAMKALNNRYAVAGILQNADSESSFNSGAIGDNGTSITLFQQHGVRATGLKKSAVAKGVPYNHPVHNMEYSLEEAKNIIIKPNKGIIKDYNRLVRDYPEVFNKHQGKTLYDALKDTTSSEEASMLWTVFLEIPADTYNKAVSRSRKSGQYLPKKQFAMGGMLKKKKPVLASGALLGLATSAASQLGGLVGSFNDEENPNLALSGASGFLSGGLVGGVTSLISANKQKQNYKSGLLNTAENNIDMGMADNYNQQNLSTPLTGFYADGGDVIAEDEEYEVEKGEVIQGNAKDIKLEKGKYKKLSDDLFLVKGSTHEKGGVDGVGGDRVFSNRLSPSAEVLNLVKQIGFAKASKETTFAGVIEETAKIKKSIEKLANNKDNISLNTYNEMMKKISLIEELTFAEQEELKNPQGEEENVQQGMPQQVANPEQQEQEEQQQDLQPMQQESMEQTPQYGYGANLKKKKTSMYAYGTDLKKKKADGGMIDPLLLSDSISNIPKFGTPGFSQFGNMKKPNSINIDPLKSIGNPETSMPEVRSLNTAVEGIVKSAAQTPSNRKMDLTDEQIGAGLSGLGYMNDMVNSNRLTNNRPPQLTQYVKENYRDSSRQQRQDNQSQVNSLSNRTNNNGLKSAMLSNLLKSNNEINNREADGRNNSLNRTAQINSRIQSMNNQSTNLTDAANNDITNNKIGKQQAAGSQLLSNINNMMAEKNKKQLDISKYGTLLASSLYGRKGLKNDLVKLLSQADGKNMSIAEMLESFQN